MTDPVPPDTTNSFFKMWLAIFNTLDRPVTWFRENIVEPNQKDYSFYHQKFRRVPTIDECYTDDIICIYEANQQFKRDKLVDTEIVSILRQRVRDCSFYEGHDAVTKCTELDKQFEKANENYFIKYGDLGVYGTVKDAYMKQKHRLIWERRHGPVGGGMNTSFSTKTEE